MNRITLAPTTLPNTPPLDYIEAAVGAGFEGLGLRLHKSPAYPNWIDWLGDAALKREVKTAIAGSGQEVVESLSYYLLPLSLEWPAARDTNYVAAEWAKQAIEGTRRFLTEYYASRAVARS